MKHEPYGSIRRKPRIDEVDAEKVDEAIVHAPGSSHSSSRQRSGPAGEKLSRRRAAIFGEVARALQDHGQVLLVGPSMTKLHFLRTCSGTIPLSRRRIVRIESADHSTDAQLVAHLRHYFHESAPRGER